MKLHVKHNHSGFVFDLVKELKTVKDLSKEVNRVIRAFISMGCTKEVIFEVEFDGNKIFKSIEMFQYRSADREMDRWIKGIAYIFPIEKK